MIGSFFVGNGGRCKGPPRVLVHFKRVSCNFPKRQPLHPKPLASSCVIMLALVPFKWSISRCRKKGSSMFNLTEDPFLLGYFTRPQGGSTPFFYRRRGVTESRKGGGLSRSSELTVLALHHNRLKGVLPNLARLPQLAAPRQLGPAPRKARRRSGGQKYKGRRGLKRAVPCGGCKGNPRRTHPFPFVFFFFFCGGGGGEDALSRNHGS